MASKMAASIKVDIFCKAFSPVTISITWKMAPHEILSWFPIHQAMLVQKLHDATLASLNVLEKKIMTAFEMVSISKNIEP